MATSFTKQLRAREIEEVLAIALAAHREWMESEGERGIQLDLSGADLRGANLHNANLHGADLYCANLEGANLTRVT